MEFRKYERRIVHLLGLQKVLMPDAKSDKLLMSEKELREMTENKVKSYSKVINNSEKIVKTTMNPEVFFKHLDLFFDHKNELIALAPYI